jgi:ASC-1-like (ASCH) protein
MRRTNHTPDASSPITRRAAPPCTHHLAILRPEYLEKIIAGEKRVECRFQRRPFPPFNRVKTDDVIWLKESCGPVVAKATAELVLDFNNLDRDSLRQIHRDYNADILGAPEFWRSIQDCVVCTLIWLKNVEPLNPFRIRKSDRRAWIPLDGPLQPNQNLNRP